MKSRWEHRSIDAVDQYSNRRREVVICSRANYRMPRAPLILFRWSRTCSSCCNMPQACAHVQFIAWALASSPETERALEALARFLISINSALFSLSSRPLGRRLGKTLGVGTRDAKAESI